MLVVNLVDWANGNNVPGYTTTMTVSLLIGGITLLSLGIIGEYISILFAELKDRPIYIVRRTENFESSSDRHVFDTEG